MPTALRSCCSVVKIFADSEEAGRYRNLSVIPFGKPAAARSFFAWVVSYLYRSMLVLLCVPEIPAGSTWVSGGEMTGPFASWIRWSRLIASVNALRMATFASALLLFGDTVLKMRYGLL